MSQPSSRHYPDFISTIVVSTERTIAASRKLLNETAPMVRPAPVSKGSVRKFSANRSKP
jgi:hypothetical protein